MAVQPYFLIWAPNHPVPRSRSISARSALQFVTMVWSASTQQILFQFFYDTEISFLHPCFSGTYCTVRSDLLFDRSLKELSNNFSHRFEWKKKKTDGPKAVVCTKKVFKCLLLVRPSIKWRLYIRAEGAYIFCIKNQRSCYKAILLNVSLVNLVDWSKSSVKTFFCAQVCGLRLTSS